MENSTIDVEKVEAALDRLTEKALRLKAILAEINDVDEEIEMGEKIIAESKLPRIVYTIDLGSIRDIAIAPAETFTPEFAEEVSNALHKIAKGKFVAPKKPIDPAKSGDYKNKKIALA